VTSTDASDVAPPAESSAERFVDVTDSVRLCYQTWGDRSGEPLVLVMGLSGPLIWWDEEFCRLLVERGFHVVRFDNRDVGRSTKIGGRVRRGDLIRAFAGRPVPPPYTLTDMADDTLALMDHLGWGSAHVVGMSMGGMIAQLMAIRAPERVWTLTSIMSTVGRRSVGWQHPRLLPMLLSRGRPGRDGYAATSVAFWDFIGSPGFPADRDRARRRAEATWDRGYSANGVLRQMLAILAESDRTPGLRQLAVPTLVVHGLADRMVHVSGGRATATAVPNAELILVEGMGHELPPALYSKIASAIRATADRRLEAR
jgi:pimeloyl-ACP methyl ester carboxylesterase